ncbi:hypothetical protein SAY87_027297 [Trapa incisa]|uniref:Uncharacterized protein n=1 Tax=Trapa incisa TaxID=236973 RepID=A0AAN7GTB6_9MYRT|nr:hypothetical protein SAY87_027297 [Trapa incisa]
MIIHLQALLGNKWAAIASYLPQRTDNDIKNYWNTHLKKKLKKYQASDQNIHYHHLEQERAQEYKTRGSLQDKTSISSSSLYASSTENISRLLEGWTRSTPNSKGNCSPAITKSSSNNDHAVETTAASLNCHHLKTAVKQGSCNRQQHQQQEEEASPSLSLLEKWLLDESTIGTNGLEEEEEVMEIPSIFS